MAASAKNRLIVQIMKRHLTLTYIVLENGCVKKNVLTVQINIVSSESMKQLL